jgi:hypothetical protein
MDRIQVMYFGDTNKIPLDVQQAFNNNANWQLTSATDIENAIDLFQNIPFDFVVFGETAEDNDVKKLKNIFSFQNSEVNFLYTNETSLEDQIKNRWNAQKVKTSFEFHDLNLN